MKRDKSRLKYHDKEQSAYCFELLSDYCECVFLSCRKQQANLSGYKPFPQIHDTFHKVGPLGGILSAMTKYPKSSWLVLACDLPYVNTSTIDFLIRKRNPLMMATAYHTMRDHLPEPLCAIYESQAMPQLLKFVDRGIYCPRKILSDLAVEWIIDQNLDLRNINTPEEYFDARKNFKK